MFELGLIFTAIVAGGIASITGFGIGSLVTPVLSLAVPTHLAVAMVSIPHFIATALRFWMLKGHLNKQIFIPFGIMSAIGGLAGALLQTTFATPALTLVFGLILLFSGFTGATGLAEKLRFDGVSAWIAGGLSGVLGGLVGNQGGLRSAALLGFNNLSKETFVATATATGLIVDGARMPVYFWNSWQDLLNHMNWIGLVTMGVVIGTPIGTKLLKRLPEKKFRCVVSTLIFLLGGFMFYRGVLA